MNSMLRDYFESTNGNNYLKLPGKLLEYTNFYPKKKLF